LPLLPRPPAPTGGPIEALRDRWHRWRHDPRLGVVLLLAGACIAGVFWYRSGVAGSPSAAAPAATAPTTTAPTATTSTVATATNLVVHVAGAVAKPGVVTLRAGSRVVDAIDAAGGARANADLDRLNLAAKLTDGERVAVPVRGQPAPPLEPTTSGGDDAGGGSGASGPINLNTASLTQLESLPGIGPTLAQAIVDARERSGGFRSVDDLRRVRGIGDARFAQVKALVTV
jgi:competence protein ComEA